MSDVPTARHAVRTLFGRVVTERPGTYGRDSHPLVVEVGVHPNRPVLAGERVEVFATDSHGEPKVLFPAHAAVIVGGGGATGKGNTQRLHAPDVEQGPLAARYETVARREVRLEWDGVEQYVSLVALRDGVETKGASRARHTLHDLSGIAAAKEAPAACFDANQPDKDWDRVMWFAARAFISKFTRRINTYNPPR